MSGTWHHGGNDRARAVQLGFRGKRFLDFSTNMNPLGPPAWLAETLAVNLEAVTAYPDPFCEALTEAAAWRYDLSPQELVWGNGASELLAALPRALGGSRALVPVPCFSDYPPVLEAAGYTVTPYARPEQQGFALDLDDLARHIPGHHLVLLGNPANPDGAVVPRADLAALARAHPRTYLVVDEAFMDFCDDRESLLGRCPANVLVVRSLTKFFCIPGLRLGFAHGAQGLLRALRPQLPSWTVNGPAQRVGTRALDDRTYQAESLSTTTTWKKAFTDALADLPGFTLVPGHANYCLLRLTRPPWTPATLKTHLLRQGIAVRDCGDIPGMPPGYLRLAVRPPAEQAALLAHLRALPDTPA